MIDSEEQAIEKTRSGEYYAAVVIPPDFSKEMLTFFSSDAHSTPLTYYINEKKNGLAPKIAGQGAEREIFHVCCCRLDQLGEKGEST